MPKPKISTEWIRDHIPKWLGTQELKEFIWNYYTSDQMTVAELAELAKLVGLKKDATLDEVSSKIWCDWKDGAMWKRVNKNRLGDDWEQYFYEPGAFLIDCAGYYDQALVAKLTAEEKKNCIHRGYGQRNKRLMDNFRMEIVSTPDDNLIVGWTVIVD